MHGRLLLLLLLLARPQFGTPYEEVSLPVDIDGRDVYARFSLASDLDKAALDFVTTHALDTLQSGSAVDCAGQPAPTTPRFTIYSAAALCLAGKLADAMQAALVPLPRYRIVLHSPAAHEVFLIRTVNVAYSVEKAGGSRLPPNTLRGRICFSLERLPEAGEAATPGSAYAQGTCVDVAPPDQGFVHFRLPDSEDELQEGRLVFKLWFQPSAPSELCDGPADDPCPILTAELPVGVGRFRQAGAAGPAAPALSHAALAEAAKARGATASACAFATLLYSDSYVPGAVALSESLRSVGGWRGRLLVLVPPDPAAPTNSSLSAESLSALEAAGYEVRLAPWIAAPPSTALPELGRGQWLKLRLWELTEFETVVYLDADTLVDGGGIEAMCHLPPDATFGAVGEYFAGAVFVLRPSDLEAERLRAAVDASGGRYTYGEQDFLNAFYPVEKRAVLGQEFHCLAEDLAAEHDISDCRIVEYASCGRLRWKPWMDATPLHEPDALVCKSPPTAGFWAATDRWSAMHAAGVARTAAVRAEL